jgi:Flp pilus assembly protein TadD
VLPPIRYWHTARHVKRLPIEWVVTARSYDGWPEEKIAAFYMQSWLLTHYLSRGLPPPPDGQPSPLSRYFTRNVPPEASEQAWREEFGMDFAELDDRLQTYSKKIPGGAIPLASLSVASCGEARTLGAAEIAQELGWLAVRLGRREEAGPLFEASLRADPNDARAHAGLGDVAKFQGRWADAPPHYARALALAPDDSQNHLELAEFALALPPEHGGGAKQVALAREHLATALRLSPDNPEAWYVLAQSYLAPGEDPKLGIPHAQRAALLLPSNENVQLLLAQVYLAAGETDAARGRLMRLMAWSHAKVADQAARLLAVLETREESAAGDGHLPDADGGSGGGAQP